MERQQADLTWMRMVQPKSTGRAGGLEEGLGGQQKHWWEQQKDSRVNSLISSPNNNYWGLILLIPRKDKRQGI